METDYTHVSAFEPNEFQTDMIINQPGLQLLHMIDEPEKYYCQFDLTKLRVKDIPNNCVLAFICHSCKLPVAGKSKKDMERSLIEHIAEDFKLHYKNRFEGKLDSEKDGTASVSSMTSTTSYIHVAEDGALKMIKHTTALRKKKPIQNQAIPRRSGTTSKSCSA